LSEGIFCDLTNTLLQTVGKNKILNTYKKGQTIFLEGTPSFGIYCISKGNVKISKMGENGRDSIIKIAGEGDILGPQGLFTESNFHTTATALEESHICFIDKKFISTFIAKHPEVAIKLISKLSLDLEVCESKLAGNSYRNVREKLAGTLLQLAHTHGLKEDNSIKINLKLSRQEFASLIGTATETLIRVLSDFKSEGLVNLNGKNIWITDLKKMEQISGTL
jgi:CRP-like cAMP-binding protein